MWAPDIVEWTLSPGEHLYSTAKNVGEQD